MLTVANEYCLFLESASKYTTDDISAFLMKITPLLYLKGTLLPVIEVKDEWANEKFVTHENYLEVYNILTEKFKDFNHYMDVDNVSLNDTEINKNDLSEKVSDVYQDLKDFVLLYQKDGIASKENAVYDCKILFESRWGHKIISIMKVLHIKAYGVEKISE